MPPSPRLTAKVNEELYRRVCDELNIDPPSIVVTQLSRRDPQTGRMTLGLWTLGRITIYLGGIDEYSTDRLSAAQRELCDTVLHELRHAWQHAHTTMLEKPEGNYYTAECEVDAREYAARKLPEYRTIIRLSRTYPNSGFSRLSRHAARQSV